MVKLIGICFIFSIFLLPLSVYNMDTDENSVVSDVIRWGYRRNRINSLDPKKWSQIYPSCLGKEQSPINLVTDDAAYDASLDPIELSFKYSATNENANETIDQIWSAHNVGGSVVFHLNKRAKVSVYTQFENDEYKFHSFHIHWHSSEHALNGIHYPAEVHLVHTNVKNPKQLAVLGFFVELSVDDNESLEPINENLVNIIEPRTETVITYFELTQFIPFKISHYYRYMGSLTTPDCSENVNWFVAHSPRLQMSRIQLEEFRRIKDLSGVEVHHNARPIQPLNQRTVRRSWQHVHGKFNKALPNAFNNDNNHANKINLSMLNTLLITFIIGIYQFLA